MSRFRTGERGTTYLELVATAAILVILAAAILPTARATQRRAKELELRRALREIRNAIDEYKMRCDPNINPPDGKKLANRQTGADFCDPNIPYPPKLDVLVEGATLMAQAQGPLQGQQSGEQKMKFLRSIPKDPMNPPDGEWDLRCQRDGKDATTWCGNDVYNVRSKSTQTALDGSKYNTW
jgi:general secretion pathway protein G